MRIAIISDIHSNIYALRSVVNDIENENIDRIYCLGDIVGYLSSPNEVIEYIKEKNIECIMGNHDEDIVNKKFNRKKESDLPKYWTYDKLTSDNKKFLKSLPKYKFLSFKGFDIRMVHGSPECITEYLFEDDENTMDAMANLKEDYLFSGHTHFPYTKEYSGKVICNPGSVGKPKSGKPISTYSIVDFNKKTPKIKIKEVEYNYKGMVKELKENNFPEKIVKSIKTGEA